MTFRIDASDVDEFAADLGAAADEILPDVKKVTGRGAMNIKKSAQRRVSGFAHLPHYPRAISYDVRQTGSSVRAEIGPDKSRGGQAPLGAIIEYGSINSAPIPHLAPALMEEEPGFVKYIEDVAAKVLEQ